MSKGDTYRRVDKKKYDKNFDIIFGENILCACNKKKCEGECKETNLRRKKGHICPAAYNEGD